MTYLDDYNELEKHEWEYLGECIHFDKTTGLYYFSDEAEQLNGPFTTHLAAKESLAEYVKSI